MAAFPGTGSPGNVRHLMMMMMLVRVACLGMRLKKQVFSAVTPSIPVLPVSLATHPDLITHSQVVFTDTTQRVPHDNHLHDASIFGIVTLNCCFALSSFICASSRAGVF